jgi:hypothetical protein
MMLIFNCTEAASKFFSRVQKGKKITPIEASPKNDPTDELPTEQWLVHAVTIQRKHVLFVMHIKTRYCMVFPDAKKADLSGFMQKFLQRWVHGVMQHAARSGVLEYFKSSPEFENLQAGASPYHFYRRGDRSVQGHLNEIIWTFTNLAMEEGLPPDEASVYGWDQWANSMLKNVKNLKGYVRPSEMMLMHWLLNYCGVSDTEAALALEQYKKMRRESAALG